ncbi:MAG: endonuclease III [Mucinivorans sp.]
MTKKERYIFVTDYFSRTMPLAASELHFTNPFELIVAVILSAQCTDKRVNMVTPALFEAMPTAQAMAEAEVDEIFAFIRSVSYPNAKATHLSSMARAVVERFAGAIPSTRVELESLAGVGRKTASVVLSIAFGANEMAVDTHVFRVARRIGLSLPTTKTPLDTERQLVAGFSKVDTQIENLLAIAHHWLILHGRYVCTARAPQCHQCGLADVCANHQKNRMEASEN